MTTRAEQAAYDDITCHFCVDHAVKAVLDLLASEGCRAAVALRLQRSVYPSSHSAIDAALAWLGEEASVSTADAPNGG